MSTENNKIKTTVELDASQAKSEMNKFNESATASQNKLNSSLKDSKETVSALDGATGGLGQKFKSLTAPMQGVAAGFKSIGGAIALSGIGLLVLTIAALQQAFTRSEEGQNKFAKIMGVIGAVTGQLLDVLASLGDKLMWVFENPKQAITEFADLIKKNIINRFTGILELIPNLGKAIGLLFSGKFAEAGKVAADAVGKVALGVDSITDAIGKASAALSGFIKETEREAQIAAGIADKRASADKLERNLLIARAKANKERADLLEKSVNKEKYTLEERINFLQRASDLEEKITQQEISAASLRLQAKVAENALGLSTKSDLDEEASLRAKLIDLETARLTKAKLTTAQASALRVQDQKEREKEEADRLKKEETAKAKEAEAKKVAAEEKAAELAKDQAAQNELDQLDIERRRTQGENVLALELALLERKRLQELEAADLTAKQIQVINEKAADAKARLKDKELKATKAKEQAMFDVALGFASESFGIAQEVGIAKMIMAAPEAIAGSFKEAAKAYPAPLSLAMGALGAAGTVAPIIKGLSDIKKARFSKSKGGSPSGGGQSISSSAGGGAANASITPEVISDLASNNSARLGSNTGLGNAAAATAANNVLGGSSNSVVFSESKYGDFQNQVAFKEEKTTI